MSVAAIFLPEPLSKRLRTARVKTLKAFAVRHGDTHGVQVFRIVSAKKAEPLTDPEKDFLEKELKEFLKIQHFPKENGQHEMQIQIDWDLEYRLTFPAAPSP